MPIDRVNPYSQLLTNTTTGKKTAATQTVIGAGASATDKVSVRDKDFPYRLYAQETLNQLKDAVNVAAAQAGIDLGTFDPSPEAVSDMISGFAIAHFGQYREQHPEMSEEEALNKYEKLISGAVNKGYGEALEILQGLGVNDEKTMDLIGRTHDLIFEKLDRFFADQRAALAEKSAETEGVVST